LQKKGKGSAAREKNNSVKPRTTRTMGRIEKEFKTRRVRGRGTEGGEAKILPNTQLIIRKRYAGKSKSIWFVKEKRESREKKRENYKEIWSALGRVKGKWGGNGRTRTPSRWAIKP